MQRRELITGLGTGVHDFAELVEACSGGRLKIRVYDANELVPAFEAFDAGRVAQGLRPRS